MFWLKQLLQTFWSKYPNIERDSKNFNISKDFTAVQKLFISSQKLWESSKIEGAGNERAGSTSLPPPSHSVSVQLILEKSGFYGTFKHFWEFRNILIAFTN